jgi:NAD(P)H dehydrogenase (quinone)
MILLMGATGNVGRLTLAALLEQGVPPSQVVAGARDPRKAHGIAAGVAVRRADYLDPAGLETAYRGVETLVLIPSKSDAAPRCVEHANALRAAKAAGVKRVVFLSVQASLPTSRFSVAPFFLFGESAVRVSGLEWTIARMSLYLDPVAEWAPELVRMGRLPYPVKQGRVAYVTRADVGRGLAAIVRDPSLHGAYFELTGPAAVGMTELAAAVGAATGTAIRFETITDDEYRAFCRADHLSDEMTEALVTMYYAVEAQEFAAVSPDIARLTGRPAENVVDGLSRLCGALWPAGERSRLK